MSNETKNEDPIRFSPPRFILFLIVFGGWAVIASFNIPQILADYEVTALPTAFLAVYAILVGASYVLLSLVFTLSSQSGERKYEIRNIRRGTISMRTLSAFIAFLLLANIASYFTIGLLQRAFILA